MRTRAVPAPALVLAAVLSVQCGAAFAKQLFSDVGPGGVVFLRLAVSALVLVVLTRPRVRSMSGASLRAAVLFGLVLAGMNYSFYEAIERIPLGVGVAVELVGPLGVAVAGSRRLLDLLWVGLAAVGVALLSLQYDGDVSRVGLLLALLAGALWAAYILVSQRVGRLLPGSTGLALALVVAAVAVAPIGIADGGTGLLEPRVLAIGTAVALLSSAIPYSLELSALRTLPARVFGVLMSAEPAAAALAGLIVLGEHLLGREWLAIALVAAASAGATATARSDPPEAAPVPD